MKQRRARDGFRRGGTLLPALLFLIAAAAVLLGFLQYRWISSVSTAEGARLKQSLRGAAGQVLGAAGDEVRVLMALLYLTPEEVSGRDWSRFSASFEFWKSNGRFPELLSDVVLIAFESGEAEPDFSRYKAEEKSFAPAGKPQVFAALNGRGDSPETFPFQKVEMLMARGVLLSPVELAGITGREPQPSPPDFLALIVDPEVLVREIVPFYMDRYLEGHPYRISEAETGETLNSHGDFDPRAEPELAIMPTTPLLFWNRRPQEEQREGVSRDDPSADLLEAYAQQHLGEDPSVRFWAQRSRVLGLDPDRPPRAETAPLFRLDIYTPGGPITHLISTRRTVNLAVSGAVLLLLVSSSIILFRLYRNTTRLRATEQEFVASMSHELRTPIAVLQSTTENLKSGVVTDPSRVSRYGQIIHRETRRLAGLVENILLYSGLEKRTPAANAVVLVDLRKLLDEVLSALREPAREAHCTIRLLEANAAAPIRSDPAALRLILENLLLNAVRHGLPADRAENAEIRLSLRRRVYGRGLIITVEDDGPGVSHREAKRIFEPFVRGEASVRAQRPGSGLGLHLVRRVVRLLGGSISLESPYDNTIGRMQRGCRFTVELPEQPAGKSHAEDSDHRG